jgi:hypothetical protein
MEIEIGMKKELNSPYIIKYYDRFEFKGETCVIMDYFKHGFFC